MTERRATLGPWLDRILIGSVGLIILWFGGELKNLTKTVQDLCVTMAANQVELRVANQQAERNRLDIDKLRADYETHLREDRQKFYLVAKPRSAPVEEEYRPSKH